MHLRLLQAAQRPWTVNTFDHALFHVFKAAGRLAGFVDDRDHAQAARKPPTIAELEQLLADEGRRNVQIAPDGQVTAPGLTDFAPAEQVAPFIADLVTCALKLALELPSGAIDLEGAVVARMRAKGILPPADERPLPPDEGGDLEEVTKGRRQAEEIVEGQKLSTLDEARRFAVGWIEVALQYARNESYWRDRAERAEGKAAEAFREVAEGLERERVQRAELAVVATDVEGVWRWQGDGGDFPGSLSCPVVMSADRLRELVAKPPAVKDAPRRWRHVDPEQAPGAGRAKGEPAFGAYFPRTDLCVSDMGGRGTGEPNNVEWLDPAE